MQLGVQLVHIAPHTGGQLVLRALWVRCSKRFAQCKSVQGRVVCDAAERLTGL